MVPHLRRVGYFTGDSTRDGSATSTLRNSNMSRPRLSAPGGIRLKSPPTYDPQLFPNEDDSTKGGVGKSK